MAYYSFVGRAALLIAVLFPLLGHAAIYTYTVTGFVDSEFSYDDEGIFGDLTDARFAAIFVLDDSSPTSVYQYGSVNSSANGGGLYLDGTTPPLSATLTINSIPYPVRTGNSRLDPVFDPVTGDPSGPTELVQDFGTAAKNGSGHTLQIGASYSYSYSCCGVVTGYATSTADALQFTLAAAELSNPDFRQTGTFALGATSSGFFAKTDIYIDRQGQSINFSNIYLTADALTVIRAVPEPSCWMLLSLGLCVVGAVGVARARLIRQHSIRAEPNS